MIVLPHFLKNLLAVFFLLLRHLLFVPLVILVGCMLWTIVYLILLVAAMIWGGGLGGPFAYPAGIVAIVLTVLPVGWGICAPATLVGAAVCKTFGWPRLAAIPVVFLFGFGLFCGLSWAYIEWFTTQSMPRFGELVKNYVIFLSLPLGVYWWLTEGPGALFDVGRRLYQKYKNRKADRHAALLVDRME